MRRLLFRKHAHSHASVVENATLQTVFFFVLPIVLLYFRIIPLAARIPVLLVFSLLIYGVIRKEKWTEKDLGISLHNARKALPLYLIATLAALAVIVVSAHGLGADGTQHWWTRTHFLFMFIVVSFFQEFAFRGFLMPVLGKIFPDAFTVIVINALLFAGMHVIYPALIVGLPVAFVGGLFFAMLYHKYPNLLLVSISHCVLNFALVYFGLFVIPH